MKKQKLGISLEVLNEVSIEFPEIKPFINEHLENIYFKENISVEEVIFFNKSRSEELAQEGNTLK